LLYDGKMRLVSLSLACVLVPTIASAHAKLMDPTPRYDPPTNSGGIVDPNGPCGGAAAPKPATAPHTYIMGSTITIKIDEVIDHPGHYEVWWGATDATLALVPGMNNIPNPTGAQETDVQFTLPNMPMDNATLQIRQVQTDTATPKNYYSCADIKLVPVTADLAGVNNMPDIASPVGDDLSGFNDFDDLSLGNDVDAGANVPSDMAHRPGADKAGLPGCSMGGTASAGALGAMLLFLFGLAALPALRRR
jgi:MYXO-CTERM domain-containing protein